MIRNNRLPGDAILGIEKGRLLIRKPNAVTRERKPIDIFFSALALFLIFLVLLHSGKDAGM